MDEGLLATIEKLAPAYAKADHNAVLPLDDALSQLLQRSAEVEGRESLGRSMGVERLASLIPDLSQHSPDLRGSLRDETSEGRVLTRSPSIDAAALQPLLLLLRVLRNLCAGVAFNQDRFRLCGAHDAVATVADRLIVAHVQNMQTSNGAISDFGTSPSPASPAQSSISQSPGASPATPASIASSPPAGTKTNRAGLFARRSLSGSKLPVPPPSLAVTPNSFGSPSSRPSSPFPGSNSLPSPSSLPSPMAHPLPRTPQLSSFPPVIDPPPDVEEVLRAVLQVLGNFATGSAANQQAVWDRCFPGTLARISAARKASVQGPLCMVLYTCCREDQKRCEDFYGNTEGLGLLSSLLAAAGLAQKSAKAAGDEAEFGGGGEWLEFLLERICLQGSEFPSLFLHLALAKSRGQAQSQSYVPEQATLLAVLLAAVSQQPTERGQVEEQQASILPIRATEDEEGAEGEIISEKAGIAQAPRPIINSQVYTFLANTARAAANHVAAKTPGSQSEPPQPLPSGNPAVDVLGYSLSLLRELTARGSQGTGEEAPGPDVLSLSLDLLGSLPPPAGSKQDAGHVSQSTGPETYPTSSLYRGYRKELVAIIANASFRNRTNQDAVREKGALLLLLQQCVVEESNPYLREWGILAVRNLLEGNEENQKEVSELQLVGGAESPQLQAAGLRVEVDRVSGKPKLVNVGADETSR